MTVSFIRPITIRAGWWGPPQCTGIFRDPQSTMKTSDPLLSFKMSQGADRYIQQVNFADYKLNFPFNVFTGSAKTGQTFLYWHEERIVPGFRFLPDGSWTSGFPVPATPTAPSTIHVASARSAWSVTSRTSNRRGLPTCTSPRLGGLGDFL